MTVEALCEPDRTDNKIRFRTNVTGGDHPACSSGWQEFDLDMTPPPPGTAPAEVVVSHPSWDIAGCRPVHVYQEGPGCDGPHCAKNFHYFYQIDALVGGFVPVAGSNPTRYTINPGPGHWEIPLVFERPGVTHTETDAWNDSCPVLATGGRCTEVGADQCVDGPSTKHINGVDVTRPCWEYDRALSCSGGAAADQCAPLAASGCTAAASTCVKVDASGLCSRYQDTYNCPSPAQTATSVSGCPSNVFCIAGGCFNTAYTNDADFARSMSMLEAAREAGVYLNADKLQVFSGEANSCRNRLLKNCCSSDSAGAGMTNQSMFGAGSRLVYDVLTNSQNRQFLYGGFQSLVAGAGFSGSFTTYGVTIAVNGTALPAGSTVLYASSAEAGTGVVVAFDPWSLAIAVIIYVVMSMMSCNQDEGKLAMKVGANLCHEIGDFCSSKVLGSCLEHTHGKCCFNSVLARIVNEQGRMQIGKGWGSAETPDCSGFTVAQLQSLDFAAMDLSEFYASIIPVTPNVGAIQGTNASRVPACYYGQGKC